MLVAREILYSNDVLAVLGGYTKARESRLIRKTELYKQERRMSNDRPADA